MILTSIFDIRIDLRKKRELWLQQEEIFVYAKNEVDFCWLRIKYFRSTEAEIECSLGFYI